MSSLTSEQLLILDTLAYYGALSNNYLPYRISYTYLLQTEMILSVLAIRGTIVTLMDGAMMMPLLLAGDTLQVKLCVRCRQRFIKAVISIV